MAITIFDIKNRTDKRPSKHNEDTYTYYNENGRKGINDIRMLLEQWFVNYPDEEKAELKARFQASFNSAFFELFIYAYFTSLGYKLDIHPILTNSTKRPDYLATNEDEAFYIEVKYISTKSEQIAALERKQNTVYEALDKIDATKFMLQLDEIVFKSISQPNGKLIISHFNKIISSINIEEYEELLTDNDIQKIPIQCYEDDNVKVCLRLIPLLKEHWGKSQRAIGIYQLESKIGGDEETIKSSLTKKTQKYGNLDKPLLICINKQSISLDKIEIMNALFGSIAWSWSENPNYRDEKLIRIPDGLFGSKNKPKLTGLSAVLFTNANTSNLRTTGDLVLIHHPLARNKLNFITNKSMSEILNIKEDYLINDDCL